MQLVAIPPFSKGPTHKGWNQRTALLADHTQLPPGWNLGLAHAYSGTMAVDVDDWGRAAAELAVNGISLQALYDAADAVTIDSGRQGHGKLIYRMPFGLALPSHKWMDSRPDGTRYNYLDFRCGTANGLTVQDVLPPSIHPLTGRPYQWAGRGHWTRLPMIPDALMALWVRQMQQAAQPAQPDAPVSADWAEIQQALRHIDASCSREEWITVGMALHYAGTMNNDLGAAGTLWDQWSQGSSKYPGPRAMETQWRSFRTDKASKVKLGSLYHLAVRGGWARPVPDASAYFEGVELAPLDIDNKPSPPDLDLSLFPAVLARAAHDVSMAVGCDPLVPLFAGLAALSGAADARTRLELRPGFKVPPVIWAMTIGEPADKKTPGSAPMFEVLVALEKEDRPRYQQAMQVYEALEARHEAGKKAYLDAAKDVESMLSGDMPQGYGEPPKMPTPLRMVVQDITSQKLVRVCAGAPRGVLVYLDEMNSWAGKLADPRSGEQVSAWTTGFESRYYKMDRVGAGEIEAENYAFAMYGNIQPRVFSAHVHKLSEDGLLQRFMPVVLRAGMTRLGDPKVQRQASKGAFDMLVRSVYGLPAMTYQLSEASSVAFVEFQRWYHERLDDERLLRSHPIYMQAFGKIEGLAGRMILLCHLMLEPFAMHVSITTTQAALTIMRHYVVPAMRYTYNGEMTNSGAFDRWLNDYLIQHSDRVSLTMADIRNSAKAQITGSQQQQNDMIMMAMYAIETKGWVTRTDDFADRTGTVRWMINESLINSVGEQREKVIRAKQRMMDFVNEGKSRRAIAHGFEELTGT